MTKREQWLWMVVIVWIVDCKADTKECALGKALTYDVKTRHFDCKTLPKTQQDRP